MMVVKSAQCLLILGCLDMLCQMIVRAFVCRRDIHNRVVNAVCIGPPTTLYASPNVLLATPSDPVAYSTHDDIMSLLQLMLLLCAPSVRMLVLSAFNVDSTAANLASAWTSAWELDASKLFLEVANSSEPYPTLHRLIETFARTS